MTPYILFFQDIDRRGLPYVGGKGANLGEMTKAGFPVPGGFCITTYAYKDFIATSREMDRFFPELNAMDPTDLKQLRQLGERIRIHLQQLAMPAGPPYSQTRPLPIGQKTALIIGKSNLNGRSIFAKFT